MTRLLLPVLVLVHASILADDWPAWRGASGQGLCVETDLPIRWGPDENVKWKVALPGPGNSTPIIHDGKVLITQATEEGSKRATMCLDRRDGTVLWTRTVDFAGDEPTHRDNPFCSASPVTDGERVIVSHGSAGVFCYDLHGKKLWSRDLGTFRHIWGNAASPVIHGGLCYVNCGPGPRTFLAALDVKTGETAWQIDIEGGREGGDRKTWTGSWSTPFLLERETGTEVLLSFPHTLRAYTPKTGKELWRCGGLGNLVYTSPLAGEGIVVTMSGFNGPPMGLRPGDSGDVTSTHRLWRSDGGPQRIGSGVIHQGHIYIVNDSGAAECLELKTGKRVWHKRLGAKSWSSLVLASDRLYSTDKSGAFAVFRASPKGLEILARNDLRERTRASVAPSNGELFLRTYRHLWCIKKSP